MKLSESRDGSVHSVREVVGDSELVVRLMELGFTKGENIRILGRALFGTPIYIEVRGTVLALRENEAECIQI